MKFIYCRKMKVDKNKNIILSVRNVSSVNYKNLNFTKQILKKNKKLKFFEILQELIKDLSSGAIQGVYDDKHKENLALILYNIALKKEYEIFRIKDSVVLPVEIIQKEWQLIEKLKGSRDKIYVFKNKYNNFFIDFKGNPSFMSRITTVKNTDDINLATKMTYLEILAMESIFRLFKSEYFFLDINNVVFNNASYSIA